MRIGEQHKETAIAYGLGAIGLLKGLVMVYAVEPLGATIRQHRMEALQPQLESNVVEMSAINREQTHAVDMGLLAVEHGQLAA